MTESQDVFSIVLSLVSTLVGFGVGLQRLRAPRDHRMESKGESHLNLERPLTDDLLGTQATWTDAERVLREIRSIRVADVSADASLDKAVAAIVDRVTEIGTRPQSPL